MGSLEEEESLFQMVHDFIESESVVLPNQQDYLSTSSVDCVPSPDLGVRSRYFTLQEIVRSGREEEKEVLENVLKHMMMMDMRGKKSSSSLKKWFVKKLSRDGYKASLCHTSWPTSMGCPAGEYEYIQIMMKKKRVIVDTDFKSQFEVARPTSEYRQLTDTLPSIFVGTEDSLIRIISILCSGAKHSLTQSGLHVPPWRTTCYMQSKWLSFSHDPPPSTSSTISSSGSGLIGKWAPPMVKPKRSRRDDHLDRGGSGLSSEFSKMSINCC